MDVDANDGKYIVIPTLLTLYRQWGRAGLS